MAIARFVSVVQRRGFGVDDSQAVIFPLIEPLFRIETHMSFEERLELFRLALQLPQGFVACEIGSYLGASTSFLAAAATIQGGHVHAVDTWRNDAMPDGPGEDTFDRFLNNTRLFQHVITTHRGRSSEMKDRVGPIDLLFVDGDHAYESVKADLTNYGMKIKPGGLLVVHDFGYESVARAINDVFPAGTLVELSNVHTVQAYRVPGTANGAATSNGSH